MYSCTSRRTTSTEPPHAAMCTCPTMPVSPHRPCHSRSHSRSLHQRRHDPGKPITKTQNPNHRHRQKGVRVCVQSTQATPRGRGGEEFEFAVPLRTSTCNLLECHVREQRPMNFNHFLWVRVCMLHWPKVLEVRSLCNWHWAEQMLGHG